MSKNNYFKGWYFKCSANNKTIAFIPAYHKSSRQETASLQIITDECTFNIPFGSLEYSQKPLHVSLGNSVFSESGIALNIKSGTLSIVGTLRFTGLSPIKYDIMGPFCIVPFMQCRHSVYSMKHFIDGEISINGNNLSFKNGIGYIEGDCGKSFPKRYIWTQCFFEGGSLMLSVADIPLFGFSFTGIIGVVLLGGTEYRIATYLGAKLRSVNKNTVTVCQGNYEITAKLIEKNAHPLYAPINGKMQRTIHESASCKVYYRFSHKDRILCEFTSDRASMEFEYNGVSLL